MVEFNVLLDIFMFPLIKNIIIILNNWCGGVNKIENVKRRRGLGERKKKRGGSCNL